MFEGHSTVRAKQICVACAATWGHADVWTQTAVKDHVWVHGPAAVSLYVDFKASVTTEDSEDRAA